MSQYHNAYYSLERKKREEISRQKVIEQATERTARMQESVDKMKKEGLDKYVSLESVNNNIRQIEYVLQPSPVEKRPVSMKASVNSIKKEGHNKHVTLESFGKGIKQVASVLESNPDAVRDIISVVQTGIKYLRNRAIEAKREEERLIREQKSKNKEKILEIYYKNIRLIDDPILIDFVKDKFDALKTELLEEDGKTDKDMEYYTQHIERRIKNIIDDANLSASEWRAKKEKESEKRILETKIEIMEEDLNNEKIELKENEEKKNELLKHIENAKKSLLNSNIENLNISNLNEEMNKINKEIDDISITEEVRRDVVKSVIKSLKDSEFTVEHPEIIQDNKGGIVKITARKPSGKRAICKIELNGKLEYLFDNYEGLTCVKDIDKFTKELEEIYSVKLSNKQVIWENPDRISKDALNIDNDNKKTL